MLSLSLVVSTPTVAHRVLSQEKFVKMPGFEYRLIGKFLVAGTFLLIAGSALASGASIVGSTSALSDLHRAEVLNLIPTTSVASDDLVAKGFNGDIRLDSITLNFSWSPAPKVAKTAAEVYAAANTPDTANRATQSSPIVQPDLIAMLDPDSRFKAMTWSGLNCYGKTANLSRMPDSGIEGDSSSGQEGLRFGRATDPLDPARIVFAFNVHASDPLTAGAKRCEALAPANAATAIPRGQHFWYAFRLLLWRGAEAQTGRALLTQWHTYGFNPFFGLVIKDGHLSFTVRHPPEAAGRQSKPTTLEVWRDSQPAQRVWMTFVVKAKISPFAHDNPYLQIWRDGEAIVDRQGPMGYDDPGLAYAKIGYYHWLNDNPWDDRLPQRSVYVSKAMLVRDEGNRLTEQQLRQWVNAR